MSRFAGVQFWSSLRPSIRPLGRAGGPRRWLWNCCLTGNTNRPVEGATGIPSAPAPASLPVAEMNTPEQRWRCVLVAEDDADDVFLLRRAFQKADLRHRD